MPTLKASVHTLGCRLNQSETSIIAQNLKEEGYNLVPFGESANLAIINTCTVTQRADSDCRQSIRKFIKYNPQAFVAVVGCYSQMGYKEIATIKGVDLIIGTQEKLNVTNYVKLGKNSKPLIIRDQILRDDFTITTNQQNERTRASLKIQDGCDFMCTFCIIPFARGRGRSREKENLLQEAKNLAKQGFKELVLTGVNIGTYRNKQEESILEVIDSLNKIPQLERIRISSIEPTTIPTQLFKMMNDPNHKLVPYLHIPLQSGSNKILTKMKRRYTTEEYISFISQAKENINNLCIGTDVMVGMPYESEKEFNQTCDVLINNPIDYCHVFSFSERDGTPATKMSSKVSSYIIKERSAILRRISDKKRYNFYESYLNKTVKVLFEYQNDTIWSGYTDNFIRVAVSSKQNLRNQIKDVKIISVVADFSEGILI